MSHSYHELVADMPVLEFDIHENVATVTLNRPEARNALSPELIVGLSRIWDRVLDDADIRAVVITSSGGSTFCAGFDLGLTIPLITGSREPADEFDQAIASDGSLLGKATLRDLDLGRPVVVAANGHAIAGGMELLLAGDLRVVVAGAKLGLSEVKLGLIPAMGGTARLARLMPPALAAEILLTGNPVSAEAALAAGFVNRVVAAEDVLNEAMTFATSIAGNAPLAVMAARRVMRRSVDLTEAQSLALERQESDALRATEDALEGPRAFLEKRPPTFRGR